MLQTTRVEPLEEKKIYTKWRKRTKLLHITVGNKNIRFERKEKDIWLEGSPWKRRETPELWHILMPERQQRQSVFFSTQGVFIKQVKRKKVHLRWTGWHTSRYVELR